MYLSRLKLKASLRATREFRLNPYLLHQAVYRAFPNSEAGGPGRILYRLDVDREGTLSLLVQSEKEPDWNNARLVQDCLLEPVACKPVAFGFREGQTLYFRLRANPSVKKREENKRNGYRLGLLKEQDQIRWLSHKAGSGGFALVTCRAVPEGIVHNEKGKNGDKLRHYGVRFEGVLKVLSPQLFGEIIKSGVGPAKGFGFGLLSVAPLRS
jgi:CRISPR system Cascade subunit CasE